GNDIYHVDNAADLVIETAGQGTDVIYATASYTLRAGQHVETISVASTASTSTINLAGNEFAQRIVGNAGQNYLTGGGGNDILVGGAGIDTLNGGTGNDILYVDNAGDLVAEAANGGTDTVLSSVSYVLRAGQHVEALGTTSVSGIGAINLTGNELAQRIDGNNGINSLSGGAGNDTLYGYAGNDALAGGTGVDTLVGGSGNDRYYVDSAYDKVIETYGNGTDTIYASVNYMIGAGQYVEVLATASATATTAINLTGNELAQQIFGNNGTNKLAGGGGNDALNGAGGNDALYGGTGNDTLTGGSGNDYFVFNTALNSWSNVDRITDFNVAADTIQLDNAVMAALGATGTLAAGKFWNSTAGAAHDADDRIIYDTDSGMLFYDADGSGSRYSGVHFATLAPNLALTNAD
ncbi:calcium-binding protein, partial [Rhizobiaceae sp. 2RAB30]